MVRRVPTSDGSRVLKWDQVDPLAAVEVAQCELPRRGNREKGIELSRTVLGLEATGYANPPGFRAVREASVDGHLEVGEDGVGRHRPKRLGGGREPHLVLAPDVALLGGGIIRLGRQ